MPEKLYLPPIFGWMDGRKKKILETFSNMFMQANIDALQDNYHKQPLCIS